MLIEELSEAKMNPSSFAASLKTAGTKDVLIGYEFEVCVPEKTYKNDKIAIDYEKELYKFINDYDVFDEITFVKNDYGPYVSLDKFDSMFKVNPKLAKFPNFKYLAKKLKKEKRDYDYTGYSELMYEMFGVSSYTVETNSSEYFIVDDPKKTLKFLKNKLNVSNDSANRIYDRSADIVKESLTQTMNSEVTVFDEYHQNVKELDKWYIEPDSSLRPKENDGAVEVVSPPLPADDAVEVLKKFYAMAKSLKLYTGTKYNTGLHINVSIPDNLDILKLAVFLGDEYAVKYFGREHNAYASQVLKRLTDLKPNIYTTRPERKKSKVTPGKTLRKTSLDLNALQKIASTITASHTASISYNGKYVSFRHAGGDYLNDYSGVLNVVGRFVQAMIIASDENMHKQEYIKKLVKLFGRTIPPRYPSMTSNALPKLRNILKLMKNNGLPVLEVSISIPSDRKLPQSRLQDLIHLIVRSNILYPAGSHFDYSTVFNTDVNSTVAKQNLLNLNLGIHDDRPISSYYLATVYPETNIDRIFELYNELNTFHVHGSGYDEYFTGYMTLVKAKKIPFTDPRAQQYFNDLKSSAKK